MANDVKVTGDVTSAPVSHIAVEFTPIPMQPGVVAM